MCNKSLGILWCDAHADFNTIKTSPTGNLHGTPVAVLCGHTLRSLMYGDILEPNQFAYFGLRDLDTLEFHKVKTKYTKGSDWTAIALKGYSKDPLDVTKPGVLKTKVKSDSKLQWTELYNVPEMKPILDILETIPCRMERVRFMKLEAGKVIGKHTDKIDKDLGIEDGKITRLHMPVRTNDLVTFSIWDDNIFKQEFKLEPGHFYYTDVRKAHAVENLSDTDRIHLVMDCYINEDVRAMIC